jgi:hypothetical protein
MEIEMRPIAEQFEPFEPCSSYGLQDIDRHCLLSIDLGRDSKLHESIVRGSSPLQNFRIEDACDVCPRSSTIVAAGRVWLFCHAVEG